MLLNPMLNPKKIKETCNSCIMIRAVLFWENKWCGLSSSANLFPSFYAISSRHRHPISSFLHDFTLTIPFHGIFTSLGTYPIWNLKMQGICYLTLMVLDFDLYLKIEEFGLWMTPTTIIVNPCSINWFFCHLLIPFPFAFFI